MASKNKGWAAILLGGAALVGGGVYHGLPTLEGTRYVAYIPIPGDVPTICQGETRGVKMGDHATKEQCDAMLLKRVEEFGRGVDSCVHVAISDMRKAAYVSEAYNIGIAAFCGSETVRQANAGNAMASCDAMSHWFRAGNNPNALRSRRTEEIRLCAAGVLEEGSK